jgi:glycosyltransferase involved in cell wall biosynthesis
MSPPAVTGRAGLAGGGALRIVFDVSPLSHERTGVNNYIRGSLAGLAAAAQREGHDVVAFAPTSPEGRRVIPEALDGIPVELRLVTLLGAHGWRTAWSRLGWPPVERWLGAFDVLHFTDWMYPPQRGGLRATTIHDLVPLHFPEWVTGRTRSMHGRKYANAARTCDLMLANSAFTADDTAATLGFPRDRIVVAHPGIGAEYKADGEAADLGVPYVLTVATLEPRKNLGTLVEAFALLEDEELALAVVGGAGWGPQPRLDRPGVVRLGRVPDEELAQLYRGAAAVAYPSRFEGFGMPITEAMASGAPVVASSHPSLDEACGDAAVRADPESPEAIAGAIRDALARRDELRAKGLAHAAGFSWAKTGERFLEGYKRFS